MDEGFVCRLFVYLLSFVFYIQTGTVWLPYFERRCVVRNLNYLQEGVLTEDKTVVSDYLDELDIRTANEEMTKAGERFGFKTIKIHEKVYGVMAEIAGVLGYVDQSSYGKLLKKWDIFTPSIGGFGSQYRMLLRDKLGIHEFDGKSLLVDWTGFLIGGVKGEGKNADAVLAYLLMREREARINSATVDQAKAEELKMKKEIHRVRMLKEKFNLVKTAEVRVSPGMMSAFKDITGTEFPDDGQQRKLPFSVDN